MNVTLWLRMAAVAVPPGNMNAIIVALNSRIKQRLNGICYFAGHWRTYGVGVAARAAGAARATAVYR
jgi:hypothetical protein